MMRSLFSGVAGLKTHQVKMDVIGNNIANVNTTAYKSSSIVFSDLMSQTTQKASGPNALTGTGGTNARQIGLGVRSGAININITGQGSSQSTGNPFDIMITGSNFFVVNNGRENFFTRDGSFYVDGAGNLAMTSTGYNVMGWSVDEETNSIRQDTVAALRIMSSANLTYPPEATSKAYASGILDKNDKDVTSSNGKTINLNFYDNLGYSYTARITFRQSDSEKNNVYSLELSKLLDSEGNELPIKENDVFLGSADNSQPKRAAVGMDTDIYMWSNGNLVKTNGSAIICNPKDDPAKQVTFNLTDLQNLMLNTNPSEEEIRQMNLMKDTLAEIYGYGGSTDEFMNLYVTLSGTKTSIKSMIEGGTFPADMTSANRDTPGDDDKDERFTVDGRFYNGVSINFDPDTGKFDGLGDSGMMIETTILPLSRLGKNFSDIEVDFSEISMYDNKGTSTVGATSGDKENGVGAGRRLGDMIGVSVQSNGMIYASYDNGMTKLLGQIATAEFANASGLEKAGDNLYSATLNSGDFDGVGVDVTANGGKMSTGQLEMSNVDLSSEFTEMITTQRGFQANSRIITVSDSLLEELTNLKR